MRLFLVLFFILGGTVCVAQPSGRCDPPYEDEYIRVVDYYRVNQPYINSSSSGQRFRDFFEEATRKFEAKPRLRAAFLDTKGSPAGDIFLKQYREDHEFIEDYRRASRRREWMTQQMEFTLVVATQPPWNINQIMDVAVQTVIFNGYYLRKDCRDYYLWVDRSRAVRVTTEFPHINDIFY